MKTTVHKKSFTSDDGRWMGRSHISRAFYRYEYILEIRTKRTKGRE